MTPYGVLVLALWATYLAWLGFRIALKRGWIMEDDPNDPKRRHIWVTVIPDNAKVRYSVRPMPIETTCGVFAGSVAHLEFDGKAYDLVGDDEMEYADKYWEANAIDLESGELVRLRGRYAL